MNNFSEWIDKELYSRGWSRREAARRAGISDSMINKVINKEAKPGFSFYQGIAKAFDMNIVTVLIKAGELKTSDIGLDLINEKMIQLPDWQQKLVIKFVDNLIEENKGTEDENSTTSVARSNARSA